MFHGTPANYGDLLKRTKNKVIGSFVVQMMFNMFKQFGLCFCRKLYTYDKYLILKIHNTR